MKFCIIKVEFQNKKGSASDVLETFKFALNTFFLVNKMSNYPNPSQFDEQLYSKLTMLPNGETLDIQWIKTRIWHQVNLQIFIFVLRVNEQLLKILYSIHIVPSS